jgi:hypothetical protein
MGMFASLSGVIGKTPEEVAASLANYARSAGGGLVEGTLETDHDNFCVVDYANGNTTIRYPHGYLEWDKSSEFLSRELEAPVFSFHIHDGDFWMYILFFEGEIVDQYLPVPDYWDEHISLEEIRSWQGDAATVARYIPGLDPSAIEKYLTRWDLEEDGQKAYEDDVYVNEDWQLIDFMKKTGLPCPMEDLEHPAGQFYKLWTKELRLQTETKHTEINPIVHPVWINKDDGKKSWWKFW